MRLAAMKRPSRLVVICLLGWLLLGAGGFAAYWKAASAPEGVRLQQGFMAALLYHGRKEKPVTAADRLRMKQEQVALKNRLLGEFPLLRVESQPVPDEQNGFLQIQRLKKRVKDRLKTSEVGDCVFSKDAGKARLYLEEHKDLVAEAARIAALPARSSTLPREDDTGCFDVVSAKCLSDIFMLEALVAAEAGDEPAALAEMRGAGQIAAHLREVEEPSLLVETGVILMDLGQMQWVTQSLLPKLGRSADLPAWQKLLGEDVHAPLRLAKVLRGEWNTAADHLFLPGAIEEHFQGNLKDPEETARLWGDDTARWIAKLEGAPAVGFRELGPPAPVARPGSLSKEGRAFLDVLAIGATEWGKGFQRAVTVAAQQRALIGCLVCEQAGQPAPTALDPVSGLPFRFDEKTRTLHAPEWDGAPDDVPPLEMPW